MISSGPQGVLAPHRYYSDFEWVRKEYFNPPYPVCTALAVPGLVSPDWILEIEATAYIEANATT
jgi:enamine deaminase RidA (YjgF/YER057c/UK114 family)